MFGYIYVNEQELKLREYTTYRSFYCGLCQELHHRYGRRAQMVLNYDTTFLSILLTGLYEPETVTDEKRCLLHPVHRHPMRSNDAISYAADMCVLLAYQKALDDWEDERKASGRVLAAMLKSGYEKIAAEYPRQAKAVEENIRLLHEVEMAWKNRAKEGGNASFELTGTDGEASQTANVSAKAGGETTLIDIDYVAGLTGNFLGELFVWKDDLWQDDLRQIGFYLGKFIYLMDAVEDIDKDRKHGNYNVFVAAGVTENIWDDKYKEDIQAVLTGMMTEAARAFERLPILEYAPIIRNILYSGVWCRYTVLQEKAGKKEEKQ